jgi:hypothetical protein
VLEATTKQSISGVGDRSARRKFRELKQQARENQPIGGISHEVKPTNLANRVLNTRLLKDGLDLSARHQGLVTTNTAARAIHKLQELHAES